MALGIRAKVLPPYREWRVPAAITFCRPLDSCRKIAITLMDLIVGVNVCFHCRWVAKPKLFDFCRHTLPVLCEDRLSYGSRTTEATELDQRMSSGRYISFAELVKLGYLEKVQDDAPGPFVLVLGMKIKSKSEARPAGCSL